MVQAGQDHFAKSRVELFQKVRKVADTGVELPDPEDLPLTEDTTPPASSSAARSCTVIAASLSVERSR